MKLKVSQSLYRPGKNDLAYLEEVKAGTFYIEFKFLQRKGQVDTNFLMFIMFWWMVKNKYRLRRVVFAPVFVMV